MNLSEDIRPLFNLAIATFAIAHLRYVAREQILNAKTTPPKCNNGQEQQKNNNNIDMEKERIRTILESFQNQTAKENEIQALTREVRDYLHNTTAKNVFGCRTADIELAVQALLLPKTTQEMIDYGTAYAHKSKEFNRFLKRVGGVDFNGSLLKTMNEHYTNTIYETAATDADDDGKPFSSIKGRPSTTTVCPPMLVGWNDYRVDSGPWGKELIYMIFLDKLHKRIIVTFRGSITLSDWAHDIRVNMQSMNNPFYSGPSESIGGGSSGRTGSRGGSLQERQLETIRIHSGFYKYLCMPTPAGTASRKNVVNDGTRESKFDEVLGKLQHLLQENPNFKLVISGHSLGGAASTLFAFMAAAAAATSATRDDGENSKPKTNHKSNDISERDDEDDDVKKEEGFRMWLPTKAKVARLFGYDTETPPVAPTSDANEENSPDDDKRKEGMAMCAREESYFPIRLPTPITVVSFGSPMVGDYSFCQAFRLLEEHGILRHLRVTNVDDIVPSIPYSSIPATVESVHLYRHVGIHLIQLRQMAPIKKFFRWSRRAMNGQKKDDEDEDPGSTLFSICFLEKTKRSDSSNDCKNTEEVTAAGQDLAKATRGLQLRTPIAHKPAKYHKRLSRIEKYLRDLTLDQLYQEYLDDNNSNDRGETTSKSPLVEKQSSLDAEGEIKILVPL